MRHAGNQSAGCETGVFTPDQLRISAEQIEEYLDQYLTQVELPDNLRQAIRYSVLGGGKRLRPTLTLRCCEAVGGTPSTACPAAAAIELIHSFSLVHDDLPAMDDDELRRGLPTLHLQAGEAMAILAGDAMMSLAFELVSLSQVNEHARSRLSGELARATTAMIVGQVYDTLGGFPEEFGQRERLELIHHNKTAALITAACRLGAICGGATERQLQAITHYGEAVGLMFQIVDDLLDVTQSAEHTGKATGKDKQAGKLTFPGLLGVEASQREIARLRAAAHQALDPLGEAARPLHELCNALAVRTK